MKVKIALTVISLFIITDSFSQAYVPFVKEGKMWTEIITSSMDTNNKSISQCTFVGDTIIGSKSYKIFMRKNFPSLYTVYFYLNEDSLNKKVYVYDTYFHQDSLWYDFSLQIGNTINVGCENLIVINKQTEYFAGSNRIKFEFSWGIGYPICLTWYEGIGSITGVIQPFCFTGASINLLCYFENDTLLYHNSHYDSCFVITKTPNIQEKKPFESYFSNKILYIIPTTANMYVVSVYDIFGRKVKEITTTGNSEINLSSLTKGLYIYRIECKNVLNDFYKKLLLN